ncbi:hypothetical protein Tco_0749369 [Tanacetum coccineum]|uniref:Uncharacterized protein n=1 Tax=Tanacetum coccineum TaxID=301880 RepID=A0ABQ4YY73_9ASTR
MYMNSWDKLSLESYKAKCEKLEKENENYIITFSSLYDNDRKYNKKIKKQDDLIETMSDQLAEEKNTVIKQTKILELEECLRKKDFENEHLKSKVVDCTMCQNLQVQVVELKSVNESLNPSVEELYKEMGDKMKRFDEEKKVFETKISMLENVLAQRVKDFDDVKIELSRRTDKFETYFVNLEKENALLKSQLASQNYTSL